MMEVTEPWTEVFSGSERTESSGEGETLSGSSLTLTPLISDSPSVRRSQPILIPSNRKVKSLYSPHSIPNPFPELCGSSKSPVHISSLPPESSDKYLVKVYGEESYNRSVWVSRRATARELFFPEAMISDSADVGKGMTPSELIQNLLRSGTCPEIQGFLQVKEPSRKTWKKVYFFLRRSGLYSSTKGSSKEPRHLQCVADLNQLNVYTVVNGRKLYGAPTDFTFCIKLSKNPVRVQDLRILSAEDESTRTCWMSAFRLFKYGKQLQYNYHLSKLSPHSLEGSHLSDGRSKSEDSLVAMDFSGKSGGRVIQNPTEAQSAEREEGRAWRKREALRCNLPNMNSDARPSSVHCGQPWFHGGMCRRKAERLIEKQGLVDGMFLIRDSQNHEQCFVLSLCHQLKVKHYLVIPFEKEGMNYFTIDDGETLFIDLLQLVEFHQVNPGILPVRLKHPCVCIAL
uniref:Growth factor receptor-bound protein 7 n=2 Tax=Nothobranchius kuhntae TaxID=321403 RepID=A0A1A8IXR3_NOTKU